MRLSIQHTDTHLRSNGTGAPGLILLALACIFVASGPSGCATSRDSALDRPRFDFFSKAQPDDAWYAKIDDWQRREGLESDGATEDSPPFTLASPVRTPSAQQPATLQEKYSALSYKGRRELAERFSIFAQQMAREHYRKDVDDAADPWPTTAELLRQGGDDCDGIDLLAYSLMRDFGFQRQELYRGIFRRERDRKNHMVTLWFEDPSDPWVVDGTGAVSLGLKRFSQIKGWRPTRVFNEYDQFLVTELPAPGS